MSTYLIKHTIIKLINFKLDLKFNSIKITYLLLKSLFVFIYIFTLQNCLINKNLYDNTLIFNLYLIY